MMAAIGAAQAEAKKSFDGENEPGGENPSAAGRLAAREPVRQQQEDENDDERGLKLAGACGTAAVGVDRWINGGAGREVNHKRNQREQDEAEQLNSADGEPAITGLAPGPDMGDGKDTPQKEQDEGEQDADEAGPIQKELAAGGSREPGDGANGKGKRPQIEGRAGPGGNGCTVGAIDPHGPCDQRKRHPAIEQE